jgi:hypothetical protein
VATAFVVVLMSALLGFAGLVVDGGLLLAAKVETVSQAQAAARAGAQAIDETRYRADGIIRLDPARAYAAATGYLRAAGLDGQVTVTATTVTVTVHRVHPTQLLRLAGLTRWQITETATATPLPGI